MRTCQDTCWWIRRSVCSITLPINALDIASLKTTFRVFQRSEVDKPASDWPAAVAMPLRSCTKPIEQHHRTRLGTRNEYQATLVRKSCFSDRRSTPAPPPNQLPLPPNTAKQQQGPRLDSRAGTEVASTQASNIGVTKFIDVKVEHPGKRRHLKRTPGTLWHQWTKTLSATGPIYAREKVLLYA